MRLIFAFLVVVVVCVAGGVAYLRQTGLRAQAEPGAIETLVARQVRSLAIPDEMRTLRNPLPPTPENVQAGMEHFATYCAMCHGNDGSGQRSAIGRGLFPKPPDMRVDPTQSLTDGELFYIIENGVRLTGMPAWSTGTPEGEKSTWQLVHFIRHITTLTADELAEMEKLNPVSPAQLDEQKKIDDFLNGGDPPVPDPSHHADDAKADPHAGHREQ